MRLFVSGASGALAMGMGLAAPVLVAVTPPPPLLWWRFFEQNLETLSSSAKTGTGKILLYGCICGA